VGAWVDVRAVLGNPALVRRAGRGAVLELQDRLLRRLVRHAYRNVPYYRRLFDRCGIDPRDIRCAADLKAIPVTRKEDLRAVPVEETLARGVDRRRLLAFRTSGSSGMPFTVYRLRSEERWQSLFWLRAARYFGERLTDREAVVRVFRGLGERDWTLERRLLAAAGLLRRLHIDCREPPEQILALLRRYRPDVLTGYPLTLSLLAEKALESGETGIRPRMVITGAQVLTGATRRLIAQAFRAPVYEWYGSRELNCIGWQCRETGELHLCEDNVIVELLKDGRPARTGESARLVGTALHSFAMPFIRYELADMVTVGSEACSCGEPFATIRRVSGRIPSSTGSRCPADEWPTHTKSFSSSRRRSTCRAG